MHGVIDRLIESLRTERNELRNEGIEAGRWWAENHASAGELIRLERSRGIASEIDVWDWLDVDGMPQCELFERLRSDSDTRNVKEFWNEAIGEGNRRRNDWDFVHGFAKAALEVWTQVAFEVEKGQRRNQNPTVGRV